MLINKITCLAAFSLFTSCIHAQDKIFEYPLSTEQLTSPALNLLPAGEDAVLASLTYKTGVTRFLLQKEKPALIADQKKLNSPDTVSLGNYLPVDAHRLFEMENIGGMANGNYLLECFYSKKGNCIFLLETLLNKGVSNTPEKISLGEGEHIVTAFEDGGSFYILSYLEKSDIIYIHVKKTGEQARRFEKTIQVGNRQKNNTPEFSNFFKSKGRKSCFVYNNTHPYPSFLNGKF
jgi:hypothetical protein